MKKCMECGEEFEDVFEGAEICDPCLKYLDQLDAELEEAERHIYPDESVTDADRIVEEDDGDV